MKYINYLFSKSNLHKQNKTTKYNFYKRKVDNKFKTGFIENNEHSYSKFLNDLKLDSHTNFHNDLFYIYFIIVIDGYLITNLLNIENELIKIDDFIPGENKEIPNYSKMNLADILNSNKADLKEAQDNLKEILEENKETLVFTRKLF